jgi:hypothetical protein
MKLKNLTYTGTFAEAVCGLAHAFRDGYAVGCGKADELEHFTYTLDAHTHSTVALCPACAAARMQHRKVRLDDGSYALIADETYYGRATKDDGGWLCYVKVGEQMTEVWAQTLRKVEADALVWYHYFSKRV